MNKTQQLVLYANLCLIIILVLSACSPSTQTNLPVTQTNLPAYFTPTPRVTPAAYPTRWRDYTPTPNSTPGVWPEFSSELAYLDQHDMVVTDPIHFKVSYPPDWYLYPGFTVVITGVEWQGTYIQNYEQIVNPENPPLTAGKVQMMISAGPCSTTEEGCPVGLPLLSTGLPGTQEITYNSGYTYWTTHMYVRDIQFSVYGYMFGSPEDNASLTKILDEILATVVIDDIIEPTPIQLPFVENFNRDCNNPAVVDLPISDAQVLSEDDIAEKLMSLYLDSFNNPQVSDFCRIDGYSIEKVFYDENLATSPTMMPKGDFMRVVDFSIKLIQIPNVWMSYSGEIDQQNWLHTSEVLAIFKHKTRGVYTMVFSRP